MFALKLVDESLTKQVHSFYLSKYHNALFLINQTFTNIRYFGQLLLNTCAKNIIVVVYNGQSTSNLQAKDQTTNTNKKKCFINSTVLILMFCLLHLSTCFRFQQGTPLSLFNFTTYLNIPVMLPSFFHYYGRI